jgi:hypothetical protein
MKAQSRTPLLTALVLFALATNARADVTNILQTASYPITGVLSGQGGAGFVADQFQFLAARFSLPQTMQITQVGGSIHLVDTSGNSMLFAALAPIDAPNGYPADNPYTFQPLAVAAFTPVTTSTDTLVPFSTVLAPGDYAVIIGSNRFGATGHGFMDFMSGDIGQPSYFKGATHNTSHTDATWHEDPGPNFHNIRFVVNGIAVPEPSSLVLAIVSLGSIFLFRKRST